MLQTRTCDLSPSVEVAAAEEAEAAVTMTMGAPIEKIVRISPLRPDESVIDHCDKIEAEGSSCADDLDELSQPDFSKLKGEICLDNLSVTELRETFRAAFGRKTASEDKEWLQRRIAMGLSNSCQISSMKFIVENGKVVKNGEDKVGSAVNGSGIEAPHDRLVHVGEVCEANACLKKEDNPSMDYEFPREGPQSDDRAAKRVRKPTKRYIEELSEIEPTQLGGKSLSSTRFSGPDRMLPASHRSGMSNVCPGALAVVTQLDSFGGSGVRVPHGSRAKRSRPRENIAALLFEAPLGNMQGPVADSNELEQKVEQQPADCAPGTSDDGLVTAPAGKGDMRRKHHRSWTLSEVMKLVEGVSRYGAGKWSEIKRFAFTSFLSRSSVDLKDKWRNLLRASLAETSHDKGASSRKQNQTPIPATILSKVRELAERQGQIAPPAYKSSKVVVGNSDRGPGSGYL